MVAAHLAECADCSAALDADEMLGGLLRNAETPSPAASYFDALPARIRTRLENDRVRSIEVASAPAAGSHRILRRWLEVAAAFVIGAGAMAVFNSLPEPGSVRRGRFSAGADAPETVALATAVESYQVDERAAMAAVPKGAAKLDATALAAPATSSLRDVVNPPRSQYRPASPPARQRHRHPRGVWIRSASKPRLRNLHSGSASEGAPKLYPLGTWCPLIRYPHRAVRRMRPAPWALRSKAQARRLP